MDRVIWLATAYFSGIAAILGSLMLLGSLLLWMIPASKRSTAPASWQNRLKLTALSLLISILGIGLLIAVPFPQR